MVDQLIRGAAADGGIRIVGAITTQAANEARRRHRASHVAAAALGRTMTSALILASSMKRPESRVNIRVRGNGPLGDVFVDGGLDGTVRGYVDHPEVELPPNPQGKLDVGGAVGSEGYLYVVRDVGYGYPYSSTVELVSGEISEDVTHYLSTSEQTPSALITGVFVDATGVTAAGGLLIQVMPKAAQDDELVELLESRVGQLTGFTPLLRAGKTLPQIFQQLLGDMGLQIFPETQMIRFHCGCSFERMLGAIKLLGEDDLLDMIAKDDGAEATCHFCGMVYQASAADLEALIEEIHQDQEERQAT